MRARVTIGSGGVNDGGAHAWRSLRPIQPLIASDLAEACQTPLAGEPHHVTQRGNRQTPAGSPLSATAPSRACRPPRAPGRSGSAASSGDGFGGVADGAHGDSYPCGGNSHRQRDTPGDCFGGVAGVTVTPSGGKPVEHGNSCPCGETVTSNAPYRPRPRPRLAATVPAAVLGGGRFGASPIGTSVRPTVISSRLGLRTRDGGRLPALPNFLSPP